MESGLPAALRFCIRASLNFIRFDAFGKRNATLGLGLATSIDGTMTVRDLGGGTERVIVILNTRNALCWGFADFPSAIPAFGRSPAEVLAALKRHWATE